VSAPPREQEAAAPIEIDEEPDEEPGMLMTSMIDVIFILLAFFICVTELKKGKLDIDVPEVPDATEAAPEVEAEPIVIEVTSEERVYVAGEPADDDATLARLIAAAARERGPEAPVQIVGDKASSLGTTMRVMSILSRTGLTRVQFPVETGG